MAKLTRVIQKIFGSSAGTGQFNEIGSFAAGSPVVTTDPTAMQSLSNYLGGWFDCVLGSGTVNAPCIQDMNALDFLVSRQLAYLFQQGIAEWEAGTTYFTGSMVNVAGVIYISIQDTNLNHATTDGAWWNVNGGGFRNVTGTDTATATDNYLRCDPTSGSFVETLPAVATTPIGKKIQVKNVASNGNTVTVKGNGSELIDFANTVILNSAPSADCLEFFNTGTKWDIR